MTNQSHQDSWYEKDDLLDIWSWVHASARREEILETLAEKPRCASDFAKQWDLERVTVSGYFKDLKEGNGGEYPALIECETPKRANYRLYGLTETGEEIVDEYI